MASKKIKDNYSIKKMEHLLTGCKYLGYIYKFIGKLGIKSDKLTSCFSQLSSLKTNFIELRDMPDRFNEHYSNLGWIAYESFDFEVMKKAVGLGDEGKIEEGEQLLVDYYSEKTIRINITRLFGIKEFRPRIRLIELARNDFFEQRYHSCIPIVIMMIDGVVNDILFDRGFFADGADLYVWDSIAANESGLNRIAALFRKARTKTTTESIFVPYRNGILHGRDLGYDNKIVAAKTWAALFSIADWARSYIEKKNKVPKEFVPPTIRDSWETIKSYFKTMIQLPKDKVEPEKWQARTLIVGQDIPSSGKEDEYADNSPERTVVQFLDFLCISNYGNMADITTDLSSLPFSKNKSAGKIRDAFNKAKLKKWEILWINDCSSGISEVCVRTQFLNVNNDLLDIEHVFRVLYVNENNDVIYRGDSKGSWKIISWHLPV